MGSSRQSAPHRLFSAADALLHALESSAGGIDALVPLYLGDLHARRGPPAWAFTSIELEEALAFLVRMGLVPKPASSPAHAGAPSLRSTQ